MNAHWTAGLSALGAQLDGQDVLTFDSPATELAIAEKATVVVPLTHLGLLDCSGDDAKTFLHTQLTSDINHLNPQGIQHSAWCTAKGRMVASFLFFRSEGGYRALLSADLVAATQKRLQMYILRSKVKVTDLGEQYALIGLSGPNALAALAAASLAQPGEIMQSASSEQGTTLRLDAQRYIVVVPANSFMAIWAQLTVLARPAGRPIWQWLDIQAGIPLICEPTREAFVPQMADFDRIGGVSFHKGCYPGQEIVARTQYLGKVKRHLYRLNAEVPMAPGMSIHSPESPDHPVGMIANAAPALAGGYIALAVIQENFIEGALTLATPDGASFRIEHLA